MSFTVTDEPTFVDLTVSEVKEEVGAIVCKQKCSTISTYHINFLSGVYRRRLGLYLGSVMEREDVNANSWV